MVSIRAVSTRDRIKQFAAGFAAWEDKLGLRDRVYILGQTIERGTIKDALTNVRSLDLASCTTADLANALGFRHGLLPSDTAPCDHCGAEFGVLCRIYGDQRGDEFAVELCLNCCFTATDSIMQKEV